MADETSHLPVVAGGVAVFAVAFVIGILTGPDGVGNKISAVLGPLGILGIVVGAILEVVRRRRARAGR